MPANSPSPQDPQLAVWFAEIAELAALVRALTDSCTPRQLSWRPSPGSWSIAECLDHLTITARKGAPFWSQAIDAGRTAGKRRSGPFEYGWLGGWFVKQVGPNAKRPMKAPAAFAPSSTGDPVRSVADFVATQDEIRRIMLSADGLDLSGVRARSAVTSLIRMNLATCFAATVAHERRHFEQIQRLRTNASFPTV